MIKNRIKRKISEASAEEKRKAREIHKKALIVDGTQASYFTSEYFEKVRKSGVTATIFTVAYNHNLSEAVKLIAKWNKQLATNSDKALKLLRAEDVLHAKQNGKVAYMLAFQNTMPLEGDTSLLEIFYDLGIRMMQLTYNDRSLAGYGCGEKVDHGLTEFGKEVIKEMNRLGMIVDLSHCGDKTTEEAIKLAKCPVFSHSNSRTLCPNVRNKPDEQIIAIAKKGGLIGVNAFPSFVRSTRMEMGDKPTVEDLLDHVEYLVELVGVEHVGLGLDFIENVALEEHEQLRSRPDIWGSPAPTGLYEYPVGISSIAEIFNITLGLVVRGYSEREIMMILGGSWLKVFKNILT
ncbi:MAG: dipeptidase [Candidatus Bathyarchaeia archaeon]